MDKNIQDIDDIFQQKMEGFEEMPSNAVWDNIESKLDKTKYVNIQKKYRRLQQVAILLLLLLCSTFVFQYNFNHKSKPSNATINTESSTSKSEEKNSTNEKATNEIINNKKGITEPIAQKNVSPLNLSNTKKENISTNSTLLTETKSSNILHNTNEKLNNSFAKSSTKIIHLKQDKKKNKQKESNLSSSSNNETLVLQNEQVEEHKELKFTVVPGIFQNDITATLAYLEDANIKNAIALHSLNLVPLSNLPLPKKSTSNTKNKSKGFHFNITPYISPQISFNHLKEEHHDGGPRQGPRREELEKREKSNRTYDLSLFGETTLLKNWKLLTGVTFHTKNIESAPQKIFANYDNDGKIKYKLECSSGYTFITSKSSTPLLIGDSIDIKETHTRLNYIGIPLMLNYTFNFKKFAISPSFGTIFQFNIKQKVETTLIQNSNNDKQTLSSIEGVKPFYSSVSLGVAFDYNLNKKISISIMPSSNIALNAINKNVSVQSFYNTFGLYGGIKLKF